MLLVKNNIVLFVVLLLHLQHAQGYRKYYVEDECIPSSKKQKIILRLPATGPDSVGEIRSNRFGTYSRTERNCLLKLSPPNGYGVVLTVLKIDFRNPEKCIDFIEIIWTDDEEKLCGYKEFGLGNQTYFSDGEIRIIYHTSGTGMGFNNGVRLIFTVTKLEDDECSKEGEFKCSNSHCIWTGVTCDGFDNCGDGSDEKKSDYPFCPEITPLAITAVVFGVTTIVTIIITMCICCCRTRSEKPEKACLVPNFSPMPNVSYMPLPGYNYGSRESTFGHLPPLHSNAFYQPFHVQFPHGYTSSNVPLLQQKVEIRCERPPPYND